MSGPQPIDPGGIKISMVLKELINFIVFYNRTLTDSEKYCWKRFLKKIPANR